MENAVTETSLAADVLTLTLTNKIGSADVVTVEYTKADGKQIKDTDTTNANQLDSFTPTAILNSSTQDVYLPRFLATDAGTEVDDTGNAITLKFSKGLQYAFLINPMLSLNLN